jgi:DNA-binding transcriptional LysR family regulator
MNKGAQHPPVTRRISASETGPFQIHGTSYIHSNMINNGHLKNFLEVCRLKNISRASESLGLSQPALTHSIKKLEEHFDTQLFVRTKKGVSLTATGKRLESEAQAFIDRWDQLKHSINEELNVPSGVVQVGCHPSVAMYTIPTFMGLAQKKYPQIQFRMQHDHSKKIAEKIILDEIECGFVINPTLHPDLVITPICTDVVTIFKPKKGKSVSDRLIFDGNLLQAQDIIRKASQKKLSYQHTLESSSLELIAKLVSEGLGHGILPSRVAQSIGENKVVKVNNAPTYNDKLCFVYKPDFKTTATGKAMIELAKRLKDQLGQ